MKKAEKIRKPAKIISGSGHAGLGVREAVAVGSGRLDRVSNLVFALPI